MKNIPQILFHIEEIDFEFLDSNNISSVLINYIQKELKECGNINYIFCDDEYLLKLNIEYLNHDYYTDILSFQSDNDPISGDIFISVDRVKENAKELNIDFKEELFRVVSHGVLHFLGYKDKSEEEIKLMRKKEDELIKIIKNNA